MREKKPAEAALRFQLNRIRLYRKRLQGELTQETSISASTMSRYEASPR